MTIYTDEVKSLIKGRQHHFFERTLELGGFDWYEWWVMATTHPSQHSQYTDAKRRVTNSVLHVREGIPQFAKDILTQHRALFKLNTCSLVGFTLCEDVSEHYAIHRDTCDQLIVAACDKIIVNVFRPINSTVSSQTVLTPDQAIDAGSRALKPGQMAWIPRGTYHEVTASLPAGFFSFGIEGSPDPSSYL